MRRLIAAFLCLASSSLVAGADTGERFTRYAEFALGTTTLADVQRALGPSRRRESGDAAGYDARICYATPDGVVRFVSGEMGGGTTVLGIAFDGTNDARCCPAPRRALPRAIASLRIGMDQRAFAVATGAGVTWQGETGTVRFDSRRSAPDQTVFDVEVTVAARFSRGRLIALDIWKVESN